MVYGTYNELVTGAFVNQLTSLGGLTLYVWDDLLLPTIFFMGVVAMRRWKQAKRPIFVWHLKFQKGAPRWTPKKA